MSKIKVFFDTNVIIDVLSDREEGTKYSVLLFKLVAKDVIKGYVSSKQITDVYYILRKYINDKAKRIQIIKNLLDTFECLPLLGSVLKYCAKNDVSDYEDFVLEETAKINNVKYIVTNNVKHFKNTDCEVVLTPKEAFTLLSIYENQ